MSKLLLKIIASLVGLGLFFYLLGRNTSIWELDVPLPDKKDTPKKKVESNNDTIPTPNNHSQPDDLKQIKGIGPVIEKKLNSIGYTHLEQIANLSEAEKDDIEERISFPGRIERDNWSGQAKALLS